MNPLYAIPRGIKAYTPSDTAIIPDGYNHGFLIEADGDISVQLDDGSIHTFSLLAGDWAEGRLKKIFSTGTTVSAGNIYTLRIWV